MHLKKKAISIRWPLATQWESSHRVLCAFTTLTTRFVKFIDKALKFSSVKLMDGRDVDGSDQLIEQQCKDSLKEHLELLAPLSTIMARRGEGAVTIFPKNGIFSKKVCLCIPQHTAPLKRV